MEGVNSHLEAVCSVAAESAAALTPSAWPGAAAAAEIAPPSRQAAVGKNAHQIRGAIGFTDEHRLCLSTTRLWARATSAVRLLTG